MKITTVILALNMFNCQNDDDHMANSSSGHNNAHLSNIKITPVSYEDFKNNKTLLEKLKTVQTDTKRQNANEKNVIVEGYEFVIHTEQGNYIEEGNMHSYTFPISRPEENGFLENIMLSLQSDGSYSAFLFTYDLTETQIIEIENHEELSEDINLISVVELEGDFTVVFNNNQENKVIYQDNCLEVHQFEWHTNPDNGNEDLLEFPNQCQHMLPNGETECTVRYTYEIINACVGGVGEGDNDSGDGTYDPTGPDGGGQTGSGSTTVTPKCKFNCPITLEQSNIINHFQLGHGDLGYSWVLDANNAYQVGLLSVYIEENSNNPEALQFAAAAFVSIVNGVFSDFNEILKNRTFIDGNNFSDFQNNVEGGYDMTQYSDFDPIQDTWPDISPIIPSSKFIGWGHPGIDRDCMQYAKAQIAGEGYQISNYFDNQNNVSDQTIQIYTEQDGVDDDELARGLSYLKYALENNIPVIVGVDNHVGTSNAPTDNTTDHFIVIVGMGSNSQGNYFIFYDNASGLVNSGASPLNLLYYDPLTGIISGESQTSYANSVGFYNYIITQIRKSKSL